MNLYVLFIKIAIYWVHSTRIKGYLLNRGIDDRYILYEIRILASVDVFDAVV